jgi:hypothetical protein
VTGIDAGTLRAMYRHMLRARLLDERIWVLNRQGVVRFWVSGMGQEAIQVALGMHVRPGIDWVAPYYRDLALSLVLGMTPRDQLLAALAKADDPNTGGRQMPAHFSSRRLNIISSGSVVATQLIHAAGIALASRIRGEDAVTVVTTGEGATSEGDFHEALNFAAIHHLAVVFVVQDNGLAISVPTSRQMPTPDVADRAAGYGIPGVVVDGTDPVASYQRCGEAVNMAVDLAAAPLGTAADEVRLARAGIAVRRALPAEAMDIAGWLRDGPWGSSSWPAEAERALAQRPPACHIAARDGCYLAFACHGCNRGGWFGPMGTLEAERQHGLGAVLLRRCLADIRAAGARSAQIAWTGPVRFYARSVGARIDRVFWIYRKAG